MKLKVAILGATSQIAKDLIVSFKKHTAYQCVLFSRTPSNVQQWLECCPDTKNYSSKPYADFGEEKYDAIINFVGVGDPARVKEMGSSIFDITHQYDQLALDYIQQHTKCKYIFLSSGAVYGGVFNAPVSQDSLAQVDINHLNGTSWYGIAKLYAEARHRALKELSIVDVRVFNYFSHTQDMSARFLITDMFRAIRDKSIFVTSSENIVRDFLHLDDFYQLIQSMLQAGVINMPVDCYTKAPVDKLSLLSAMQREFGLHYDIVNQTVGVNATGSKLNFYSLNTRAADFGYEPSKSSLECILLESEKALTPSHFGAL